MKLSTLGLGFVVAASSFVGISSLSQSATAATIGAGAQGTSFNFVGTWEFTFLYSFGRDKSSFGISPFPTLFTELSNATPGVVTPNSSVTYTFTGSETNFFLTTGSNTFLSSFVPTVSKPQGFYFASEGDLLPPFVTNDGGQTFASFVNTFAKDGALVIGVNDSFKGDSDYNDFIVKAKPVPVPAIVPGIALAAAFFGSKTLKRNKKESKTVA